MTTVFVTIDHFVGDEVGIHAARLGTRFEALEPIHQGIRKHFGDLEANVARNLVLHHDQGSHSTCATPSSKSSGSWVSSPAPASSRRRRATGMTERGTRTLKEQLLRMRIFDTLEELWQASLDFKERFNQHWLL